MRIKIQAVFKCFCQLLEAYLNQAMRNVTESIKKLSAPPSHVMCFAKQLLLVTHQ